MLDGRVFARGAPEVDFRVPRGGEMRARLQSASDGGVSGGAVFQRAVERGEPDKTVRFQQRRGGGLALVAAADELLLAHAFAGLRVAAVAGGVAVHAPVEGPLALV